MWNRWICFPNELVDMCSLWQCGHVVTLRWWRHCVLWSHQIAASHGHSHTATAYCSVVTSIVTSICLELSTGQWPEKAPTRTLSLFKVPTNVFTIQNLQNVHSKTLFFSFSRYVLTALLLSPPRPSVQCPVVPSIAALPMHHGPQHQCECAGSRPMGARDTNQIKH